MTPVKQKTLLLAVLLLAAAGYSIESQACYLTGAEQRSSFNMGTIVVQRDTPTGTVLSEKSWAQGSASNYAACPSGDTPHMMGELKFPTLSTYGNYVYNTNIAGIGIRVYGVPVNATYLVPYPYSSILPANYGMYYDSKKIVQLVKTSANTVGAGAITTGTLMRGYIVTSPRLYYSTITLNGGTIVAGACTVTNTSILVPLGDTARTDFKGVSTSSKDVPFNIPLNCNANTKVKITLNGTAAPGGAKGVIALSPSSSETVATGVGVQMLYKNAPVTLGSAITVGTASSGIYNIPLVGRYYQTEAKVTSGKANAMATFTMTYN